MKFFVRTENSTFYFTRVFPFHREVAAWARKRSLGTRPDQESNPPPSGGQDDAPNTRATQPGRRYEQIFSPLLFR